MRVSHLSLVDFRNYEAAEVEFAAGPNLLLGRNGQGKTNLVEAIGYFSTLRSHRVSSDSALIRSGEESAVARVRVEATGRSVLLEVHIKRDRRNQAMVNRNFVRPRELMRWIATVAFVPEDLSIVRGDPSGRRRFLDDALSSRFPIAAGALADYERVLRQRTSLLKSARRGSVRSLESTLEVWDEQLIAFGTQIMLGRRELVDDLRGPLGTAYEALVGQDHAPGLALVESVYASGGIDEVSRETGSGSAKGSGEGTVSRETLARDFRAALTEARPKEIERGLTLVGPHRDDVFFTLNDLPVKGYASHGESWSFALSLKIALANVLRTDSPAGDPVIVLDDVFAELDRGRRERLMRAVSDFEQILVTAAAAEDIPDSVDWHRIYIDDGAVVEGPPDGLE
ncbi:DNA replication/repair protein RecF [Leucobacter sp. GX0328]